ncbi:aldehyde dehydrogenase family protein [cyanobacterium endosymbiont of Rhopalodia gibberula]|uniref:aldehyde dehydrogenase family protein n=1 Tax=cyanobacterium endosymbiont of Rhopalodia gibberula TaxID=1763363 RepID=UPI0026931B3B
MEEEIFGLILLVLEYGSFEEAITWINKQSKPLVLYFFPQNQQKQKQILNSTSSGRVYFNDAVVRFGVWGFPLAASEKVV